MGYTIPDEPGFVLEGYEWGVQIQRHGEGEWTMTRTNRFDGWYPSEKSAKNALAQVKAPAWGYQTPHKYRLVKRPFGAAEVVNG